MPSILLEASSYQKKYKCPYCEYRGTRIELVSHINKYHQDMIPKDYTATRVVFNLINKKEHGSCIICRRETKWDENKARYDRLCERKSCHDTYVKQAHANTDIENKLRDPMFQQKMLAGRSISGTYKFADGGLVSYTGSYEKQLLEFLDIFLKVKSYDIQSPGPVIEYEYNGQKHLWITDQYYIPYNLVFDVKDGGNNPNNREMKDYREKQIAKEKAIKKQGKYNYIRLTNNDFEQLLDIMLELKESFNESDPIKKPIIRINENSNIAISTLPPAGNPNNTYIIDYMKRNTFIDNEDEHHYAICKNYMQNAVTVNNGSLSILSMDELKDMDHIRVFKCNEEVDYMDILESVEKDTDFYSCITGKDLLDSNQLQFDSMFSEVIPYSKTLNIMEGCIRRTLLSNAPSLCNETYNGVTLPYFPLIESDNDDSDQWKYYRDIDGVFLMNESTGFRSVSYSDIEDLKMDSDIIKNLLNNNISNT